MNPIDYTPSPIDTSAIQLTEELQALTEPLARNVHEHWASERMKEGWRHGASRSESERTHPHLVPYGDLPEPEQDYDRRSAMETLKVILCLGFQVLPPRSR